MIHFLKHYGYAIFLGFIPSVAGINILDWQWWIMTMPIIILVNWRES
jgi:hypothetical protein